MGARERFIQHELEEEGKRMLRNQGNAIFLAYREHSGRLMRDRRTTVSGGDNPVLTFTHPVYERFLDLKSKRGTDRRIHNRFVYGTVYAIQRRLALGLLDEAATMLRTLEEPSK